MAKKAGEYFKISKHGGKGAGVAYSSLVALYIMISFLAKIIFFPDGEVSLVEKAVSYLYSIVSIAVVIIAFIVGSSRDTVETLRINPFNPVHLLTSLLVAAGMLFGLGWLNIKLVEFWASIGVKVDTSSLDIPTLGSYLLHILLVALLPAIFEEAFFRGLIIKKMRHTGFAFMVLFSSLMFALYHFNYAQFAYQFLFGVVLALLLLSSDSVIPPMIAHFANNFVLITLTYFKVNVDFFDLKIIFIGVAALLVGLIVLLLFGYFNKKNEKPKFRRHERSEESKALRRKKQRLQCLGFSAIGLFFSLMMILMTMFM